MQYFTWRRDWLNFIVKLIFRWRDNFGNFLSDFSLALLLGKITYSLHTFPFKLDDQQSSVLLFVIHTVLHFSRYPISWKCCKVSGFKNPAAIILIEKNNILSQHFDNNFWFSSFISLFDVFKKQKFFGLKVRKGEDSTIQFVQTYSYVLFRMCCKQT